MNDLDTDHYARGLEASSRDEAERARRRLRSHWTDTQPLGTGTGPRPVVPALHAVRSPRTGLSAPSRSTIETMDGVRRDLGLSIVELWWRYFALGGLISAPELAAVLNHAVVPSTKNCDLLAIALNERSSDLGGSHLIPFSTDAVDA